MQVAGIAEGFAAAALDGIVHHRPRHGLEQDAERGHRQRPTAIGEQAHAHHVPAGQSQQYAFAVDVGNGRCIDGVLRRLPALADQPFQRQCLVQLQYPHLRFRAHTAGRFQAQLGHAEQAVQRVLPHFHVVDAGERDPRRLRANRPLRTVIASLPMR